MILTSTETQPNLPRYFAQVFAMADKLQKGRIDFILPDGRHFRAEGKEPGPVAEVHVHNSDLFARLILVGDLASAMPISKGGGARRICRPSWISCMATTTRFMTAFPA
jgi:hypothetical protein